MTPEEYRANHQRRVLERMETLRGRPFPYTNEEWEGLSREERSRENAVGPAAIWLEDYGMVIHYLAEFTGESIETMTAFYFGMAAKEASEWIHGLTKKCELTKEKPPTGFSSHYERGGPSA